uniref:NSD-1 n=1 Tax=Schmidtea mediterranea TaxID=79327 RepID=H9CXT1_SCHMD|nr:NSD-1 [Schmidtea mediterranea]
MLFNSIIINSISYNMFKELTNLNNNSSNVSLLSTSSNRTEDSRSKSYKVGQIICGKVGKYPWWPCMVNTIPTSNEPRVLVSYFGKKNDYSYLFDDCTMYAQTKSDFENIFKLHNHDKKTLARLAHYKKQLDLAWKEVEIASLLDENSRFELYKIKCEIKESINPPKKRIRPPKPKKEKAASKPQEIIKREPIKYAFDELTLPFVSVKLTNKNCRYCLETKNIVQCNKCLFNNFHVKCLEFLQNSIETKINDLDRCLECSLGIIRCYACYKIVDISNEQGFMRCIIKTCTKWFHTNCLETGPMLEMTKFPKPGQLVCPCHICHKCELVNPSPKYRCTKLIVCIMCPATFHTGDWCIPAGSVELNTGEIICPRHLVDLNFSMNIMVPPFVARVKSDLQERIYGNTLTKISEPMTITPSTVTKPTNVNWCFKCGEGGELLCCETCPAAYHFKCTDLKEIPQKFYCPDCASFCYRSYGEIVWIKCGTHPWWPGQILHLENVPKNIAAKKHANGQFVVQFFGSRDYMWRDHGNVFLYEKEDECNSKTSKYRYNNIFLEGIKEAAIGYVTREEKWQSGSCDHVMNSKIYNKIQVNKCPLELRRKVVPETPHCNCISFDPKSDCSIGSGCFNVASKCECDPQICNLGDKCKNQNFVKRIYPKQYTFWANDRGWGLKADEFIKTKQFVNEYIGEIITMEESEKRILWANENNITDFYFMELDNGRLIDARQFSNLSRFINNSCDPNLVAEKWIVNREHRIGLFALRDIQKGEELTFQYNLQNKSSNRIVCKCFSVNCSGFLGEAPKMAKVSKLKSDTSKKSKGDTTESESSCKSFLTDKNSNSQCFRCGEIIDMLSSIVCSVGPCMKTYHSVCLNLNMANYVQSSWICPHHYCDVCARPSHHFSSNTTESYCNKDFIKKFNS